MSTGSVDALNILLNSPEFLAIWEQTNDRYLSWNELQDMPMPEGFSAEDIWGVISVLNRRNAMVVPYDSYLPNAMGKEVWIARTATFERLRHGLRELTGDHSVLWHEIKKNGTDYFCIGLVLEELLSVLSRDGIDIGLDRAKSLWLTKTSPANSGERVFLRLIELFSSVGQYDQRRLGIGLIETLYDDVCLPCGLDAQNASFTARHRLDLGFFDKPWSYDHSMGVICSLVSRSIDDGLLDPFVALLNIAAIFWDWTPLPQLNASVAFLFQSIFCRRAGIPACSYMPISKISSNWESGRRDDGELQYSFPETMANQDRGYGVDSTPIHMRLLELCLAYAKELETKAFDFRHYRHSVHAALDEIHDLNPRQRATLVGFSLNPRSTLTIEEHRQRTGVAYSTARADLVDLSDRGFLSQNQEDGKAGFSFGIGRNLLSLLKGIASSA